MSSNNLTVENRHNPQIINYRLKSLMSLLIKISLGILIGILLTASSFGQAKQYTGNTADQNLRGSGRVNPSTLGMEFGLSLGGYPGRGINLPINLSYSSKVWGMEYTGTQPGNGVDPCYTKVDAKYAERSVSGWTTSLAVPYIEYTGTENAYNHDGEVYKDDVENACDPGGTPTLSTIYFIRRITLYLPGGESHELRLDDSSVVSSASWDGTYYAADGSNIRFIQNSTTNVYKVQMPDGSFYDFNYSSNQATKANKYTDRNGNYITYHAATTTYPNGYITDTLGKDIPIPLAPTTASVGTQTYSMPGIDGTVDYILHWNLLKGSSAEESGLTNFSDSLSYISNAYDSSGFGWTYRSSNFLFASEGATTLVAGYSTLHNPIVLTGIDLPNGEKYKFTYNVYGELERIYYPTGGEERFEYEKVKAVSIMESPYSQANRGVIDRKVYETAGSGTPSEWQYATPSAGVIQITNPDNTKVVRYLHLGNVDSYFGFDNALAGIPYREFNFSSAGQLQTQKFTYWTKNSNEWHPRVEREESIIYNSSGAGLSSTAIYEFEGDLSYKETPVLVNKTSAYAFEVVSGGSSITPTSLPTATPPTLPSSAPSTLLKSVETTYLINDSDYSSTVSNYTDQNIVGLVTASVIKDGSGTTIVAKSKTVYDESSFSPGYVGNPTTSKVWDSTKGAVSSSGAYISSRARYDSYGNLYETTDALGNSATTTFDSTYHAFPISVTTEAPDQSGGAHGSTTGFTTSATFDPTTGLTLTATDINGQTTEMEYDPVTLRPTVVTAPNGQETQFSYGIPNSTTGIYTASQRFAKVRTQIDSTNWKEGYKFIDGLGRAIKSQSVDSNGDVFGETEYDIMGRVKRSTNPYKTGDTKQWTTPTYDDMGRTIVVTLPDTSTVQTAYGLSTSGIIGLTKTVTDQDGKKRKGITDGSGNMVRVIEDPDGQNLATDYVFDTLGLLRKTTQGGSSGQKRYFMHDSLGRLLYAKQVEQDANSNFSGSSYTDPITGNDQWSVKYVYDDSGKITSTTDANNVTVTGVYDHLNRLVTRSYDDSITPNVDFYYDGKYLDINDDPQTATGSVLGKMTGVKSSVSRTNYIDFDDYGRLESSQQITDGQTYTSSYAYNLSGALIEETYPSTRVVKNTLNQDGELALVQSKKNSSTGYYAYAMGFSYNAAGALEKMRLGNGHWETYTYDAERLQITKIGLGTTDATQDILKLEFDYGDEEHNNGSMREQKITVPALGSDPTFTAVQSYDYDGLNRLQSAEEKIDNTTTWKQTFSYDIYGNRRFNTSGSNTTTLPSSCTTAICNPTISTSNNRFSTGQGYSYDANGSLTEDGAGQRFGYDAEGRQNKFFVASNSSSDPDATYYYDGEGKRVKKISSTEITVFVYDGSGHLVEEYSTALAVTPQVSYLTTDHLGSARIITNENGAVTKRQDFSAFGEEIDAVITSSRNRPDYTGNKEIRQDYTGYQEDIESGLEYAQARYYNSQHGRFTSVDPLTASAAIRDPQTFNRYSYALNSPYKFTDPLGLKSSPPQGEPGRNRDLDDFMSRWMVRDFSDWRPSASPVITHTAGHSGSHGGSSGTAPAADPPPATTNEEGTVESVLGDKYILSGAYVLPKEVVDDLVAGKIGAQGDGSCAQLPQVLLNGKMGVTSGWVAGMNLTDFAPGAGPERGTVIATMQDGKYPNAITGNHVAIFLRYLLNGSDERIGMVVINQWHNQSPKESYILFPKKNTPIPQVPSKAAITDGRVYWVVNTLVRIKE